MPQTIPVLSSLSVSCWSSSSQPPIRSMSSAKRTLQSDRPPIDTDDSEMPFSSASSNASPAKQSFSYECRGAIALCITFSMSILNSTGDNGHPCRTPIVVRKKLPFGNTELSRFIVQRTDDFNQLVADVIDSPRE